MTTGVFDTILVANRGEIACRVIRTAADLGYRTVAVYSDADAEAPHVHMADEAIRIGPAPAAQSYLDPARILAAAEATGSGAIHPGYGFLSENAAFAAAVESAGLVFIGPRASSIDAMGDKAAAKVRMRAAGVPVVPGYDGESQDDAVFAQEGARIGYPVLVKASAGGGGRGMRRVNTPEGLPDALERARGEAGSAFGNTHLILEKLVEGGRHVEVQVLADAYGHTVHLGERDCSTQRRHQKVIEEAPSPAVSELLRERMGEAAVEAARAVDYRGAGTVEFLLSDTGEFYFLEMNTRLQVEHPVTELVTGLNLVELQIRVAAGEPLALSQDSIVLHGHAVEARVYAEQPEHEDRPEVGTVVRFEEATGPHLRTDHFLTDGTEISPHYDPMLAKIMAWGPDRNTALRRLAKALDDTVLLGLSSNVRFLAEIIRHPTTQAGEVRTDWLSSEGSMLRPPHLSTSDLRLEATALWLLLDESAETRPRRGFRNSQADPSPISLVLDERVFTTRATVDGTSVHFTDADGSGSVQLRSRQGARVRLVVRAADGTVRHRTVHAHREADTLWMRVSGHHLEVRAHIPGASREDTVSDGVVLAPGAGKVVASSTQAGANVSVGDVLLVVEAMKLETPIRAPLNGVLTELRVAVGDLVKTRQVLALIEPSESTESSEETP